MAVSFSPSPDGGAEMKLRKVIEELRSELQEHKQSYRNLEEKFLACQSMTCALFNQFQKYENGAEDKSGKEQELLAPRPRKAAQEEKEVLQDSLDEGKKTSSSHSEFSDIHQPPCFSADLLEYHDNGSNDEEEAMDSSLNGELQKEKENDLLLDEKYFLPSSHPDPSDSQELLRSSVFPSDEPEVSSAVDEAKLNLDAFTEVKNHPKVEGGALGDSAVETPGRAMHVLTDAKSVVTQKIMKRKPLFCKWKIACRFPGLQDSENHEKEDDKAQDSLNSSPSDELPEEKENDLLLDEKYFLPSGHPDPSDSQELLRSSVFPSDEPKVSSAVDEAKLNLDASIPMKTHAKIEGDALKGSSDNTCGFQEHVLNDSASVWKQKIIRGKLLFPKWRIACRFPGLQASELDSDDPPGMKNSPKLEGDAMDGSFADKNGHHVIGHINDYTALTEKIGEGKQLVQKILSLLNPTCNFLGFEAQSSEAPGNMCFHELRSSACALHHTLEKSSSLLTMFWRAALPSFHGPGLPGKVDESMERELLDLRAQVSKQEKLLQSTAERLKTVNQQKENMEQFIVSQLTRTHDVLKKARTNLELRKRSYLTQSQSLLQIHHRLSPDL